MKTSMEEYLESQEKKHGFLDNAETAVLVYLKRGNLTQQNLFALLKQLRGYEKKAKPGNFYWNKLEQDYGYCLDYTPADAGNYYEVHNS